MPWVAWLLFASTPTTLVAEMRARGIDAPVVAFATDEAIEAFARTVSGEAEEKAQAIYRALVAKKRAGAIVGDRDNTPKSRPPKTASDLWAIANDGDVTLDRSAGCYELSVLFVAIARSAGLDAIGVERRGGADTGQVGHIMGAVRSGGRLSIFDLQNETQPPANAAVVLSDIELAAHHYNHLAVAAYLADDILGARRAADDALALAPTIPGFLANRATVLLRQGEQHLALAEATHAVEIAPTVPIYRYVLGRIHLEAGDYESARTSFADAVALHPSYDLARRDLGWTTPLLGKTDEALRELVRLDASTPDASLFLAVAQMVSGDETSARRTVATARARDPTNHSLSALDYLLRKEATPAAQTNEAKRLAELIARLRRP